MDEPKGVKESGDETATEESPTQEQTAEEVEQPEVEVTAETEGEATETVESKKKGYEARVRELNAKANAEAEARVKAEAKAQSLAEKLAELTSGSTTGDFQIPQYNPQEPLIAAGEEIDVNELNKRQSEREAKILQQMRAEAELGRKQSEAIGRINNEALDSVRKYPELDPDSDSYNSELSETITEAVEAYVKANPYSASVLKFVDKLMKPYKGAVTKEVGEASENLAKQVSQSALKPTSIRKVEKMAQEKTIEELEQELGIVTT